MSDESQAMTYILNRDVSLYMLMYYSLLNLISRSVLKYSLSTCAQCSHVRIL
jgi:hypothetical protein